MILKVDPEKTTTVIWPKKEVVCTVATQVLLICYGNMIIWSENNKKNVQSHAKPILVQLWNTSQEGWPPPRQEGNRSQTRRRSPQACSPTGRTSFQASSQKRDRLARSQTKRSRRAPRLNWAYISSRLTTSPCPPPASSSVQERSGLAIFQIKNVKFRSLYASGQNHTHTYIAQDVNKWGKWRMYPTVYLFISLSIQSYFNEIFSIDVLMVWIYFHFYQRDPRKKFCECPECHEKSPENSYAWKKS